VEIMVVVSIVSLLAVIAMPSFLRARQRSQNVEFINDLRVATSAFELYAVEHKGCPPNVAKGVLPPGMDTYFGAPFDFTAPTPIGGAWDWDFRKSGVFIGVSVVTPTVDTTQLQEIDAMTDDGDLSHGGFVKTGCHWLHRNSGITPGRGAPSVLAAYPND
jgi:type II secretory pathway pseudopilin PulG